MEMVRTGCNFTHHMYWSYEYAKYNETRTLGLPLLQTLRGGRQTRFRKHVYCKMLFKTRFSKLAILFFMLFIQYFEEKSFKLFCN